MNERGHAAVEFALAVGVLLLPAALAVLSFGPWVRTRVEAEAIAAETARTAVLALSQPAAESLAVTMGEELGFGPERLRLGWCDTTPTGLGEGTGSCQVVRGGAVSVTVQLWTPAITTPWGGVGGLWVTAEHAEPIDLYRSLP